MATDLREVLLAGYLDLLRIDQTTRVRHLQIPNQHPGTRD